MERTAAASTVLRPVLGTSNMVPSTPHVCINKRYVWF